MIWIGLLAVLVALLLMAEILADSWSLLRFRLKGETDE